MRVSLMAFALAALVSGARAEDHDLTTAILVQPIHDAQVVHADDGNDHVDYELLVVNVFAAPVTLSSVIVLDPSGKELGRIEGDALAAATQTLLAQTPGASIPASAAASVDVDLALPAGTAPDRVTHRIVYAIKPDAPLASIVGTFSISGPEVQVNRAPAITIRPPLTGKGWWAANGCCAPNAHRDTRIAIDGSRIETPETFAIDWTQLKDGKTFEGDGARNEEHYAFGADVLAVADGTVVSVRDGMPEETPSKPPVAVHAPGDYGGNYVILQLAANVYAAYAHMQPGSISVKPGERVRGGDRIGKLGNTGNSTAPHLHFSLLDRPDFLAGRSLPFVFDSFVYGGTVVGGDPNKLEITGTPRAVKSAYPLFDPEPGFPKTHEAIAAVKHALAAARPGNVVFLSTVGAHVAEFNLLNNSKITEAGLRTVPVPVAFLRAAWFMENATWDVEAAKAGVVSTFLQPLDHPIPMVATADIGSTAADLLRESWRGLRVVELEGPRRYSANDVAAGFGEAVGHPVQMEPVPRGTWEALFRSQGMKHPLARIRMIDGFNEGWIDFEGVGAEHRIGKTPLGAVLKDLAVQG